MAASVAASSAVSRAVTTRTLLIAVVMVATLPARAPWLEVRTLLEQAAVRAGCHERPAPSYTALEPTSRMTTTMIAVRGDEVEISVECSWKD